MNFCFGIRRELNSHARARNPDSTSRLRCRLVYPRLRNQAGRTQFGCIEFTLQYLARQRYLVNGELNVTNLIPPVNLGAPF